MRFLHPERDKELELSLDDVFLLPQYWEGASRSEVDLRPADFAGGAHPVVSANMNGVTGKRMAETMARCGGLGVLPQDMELRTLERIVAAIKRAHPRFDTPLEVTPEATLRDVQGILWKRSHGLVVVVDPESRPIGIVSSHDLKDRDQYTPVSALMTRRLRTLPHAVTNEAAFSFMDEHRLRAVPIVDDDKRLLGILTRDDAVRMEILRPSLDAGGRLMVAAAMGIGAQASERARQLLELGVDALVLDTAHGHQRRMIEALKEVTTVVGGRVPIIAGNVCTAEGTRALLEAGADVAKVNVGPGAMCTTRMQTGAGRPTFSSVLACAEVARAMGKHVWADGGVKHPRDVALYLAAGASRVMVGTALAGTYESPGDIREDRDGQLYKENYGMASARAVLDRTTELSPFEQAKKAFFREGISTSRIYLRPGFESVGAIIVDMITGLQSALTYTGAKSCEELTSRAVVGVQTLAGYGEGKPHGAVRNRAD